MDKIISIHIFINGIHDKWFENLFQMENYQLIQLFG